MKDELTWIELSRGAFQKNLKTLRRLIGPKVLLAPCVKANAYGHGLFECARILTAYGADWLCVDSADEAIFLRQQGIKCPMLIMGYVGPKDLPKVVRANVRVFLYNLKDAHTLAREAKKQQKRVYAHVKVDTGMNRQGVALDELEQFLVRLSALPGLVIEGIATHFATSDELSAKRAFYHLQKKRFNAALLIARAVLDNDFLVHCANSGATLTDTESHFSLVRPGIAVYGYYPSPAVRRYATGRGIHLVPAMSFHTQVAQIKMLRPGAHVSYGGTFVAKKKMKIAVLPIGYYDGLRRDLSNRGYVLIRGRKAKIIGRVCMNILMVDITRIPKVTAGEKVTIIGRQGREVISADTLAEQLHTINYEILANLRESINKYIVP